MKRIIQINDKTISEQVKCFRKHLKQKFCTTNLGLCLIPNLANNSMLKLLILLQIKYICTISKYFTF